MSQLIVRIDNELKNKVSRLALAEGKTTSQVVREVLETYVRDRDMGSYIDQLWDRIGAQLKREGVDPERIGQAIRDVRETR